MLVSIAEHIGAPIGATQTTTLPAVSFAVTIQRTSGSATTASGETTASLTHRRFHDEALAARTGRFFGFRRGKKWFRAPDKRLFKQLQKTLIAPD